MKKSFLLIIVLTLLCASCQKKTSHNVKPTENTDVINPTSFDVKVSHLFTNYDEDTHEYKYMYDKMLGHKRGLILGFPKNSGSFRYLI